MQEAWTFIRHVYIYIHVCWFMNVKVTQLCPTLCNHMGYSLPGFSVHGILQARILEWIAVSFSRRIPTPGIKPKSSHCRWFLYHLSYQGSQRILEWTAYPFSSGSSQPRNQTGVSCLAGGFLPAELLGNIK